VLSRTCILSRNVTPDMALSRLKRDGLGQLLRAAFRLENFTDAETGGLVSALAFVLEDGRQHRPLRVGASFAWAPPSRRTPTAPREASSTSKPKECSGTFGIAAVRWIASPAGRPTGKSSSWQLATS